MFGTSGIPKALQSLLLEDLLETERLKKEAEDGTGAALGDLS